MKFVRAYANMLLQLNKVGFNPSVSEMERHGFNHKVCKRF